MENGEYSLGELAVRFGMQLRGDPDLRVARVATLLGADSGTISFLANPRYRRQLGATRATAVILTEEDSRDCPVAALIDPNPYLAYARIASMLHRAQPATAGIHASAVVSADAQLAATVTIGPLAVVEAGVQLDDGVYVGPGCILQAGASIGAHTRLTARVSVAGAVRIGRRCIVQPGAVIGYDGFGFAADRGAWVKVPQVGRVRIGDDVEIGANTSIDCGAIDDTVIENGVKLDNQIQVGHNVTIGEHTAIAACTGISGSTTIGRRCMIGGMVGFAGHLTSADDGAITGCSLVSASIRRPGSYSSSMPTQESRIWRRMVANLRRLAKQEHG